MINIKKHLRYYIFFLLGITMPFTTLAHPHSFIDMQTKVLFKENKLTGFEMFWQLDEIASSDIIYELNNSKNRENTKKFIEKDLMDNLIKSHYFSYLYDQNNNPIKYTTKPSNYYIEVKNHRVLFHFTFYLTYPQSIEQQTFRLMTYDPSYYVSMTYSGKQDIFSHHKQCTTTLEDAQADSDLRLYAAGLDKNQSGILPDNSDGSLGAMFAQTVNISCH